MSIPTFITLKRGVLDNNVQLIKSITPTLLLNLYNNSNINHNITNSLDNNNQTLLHFATKKDNYNLVNYLLYGTSSNIDINVGNNYLRNILHIACEQGFIEIAKLIINKAK